MHIHILGICGTFMGGLAVIARQAGFRVTGCDANVYPPMSEQLAAQGIDMIQGFDADQISLQPDVFVVGNVVARGRQPLMEEILNGGLPYVSGPQWLYEQVLRHKWVLAVAGTHGKTTTSAMLAWILEDAGLTPGYLVGGVPQNFGVSARLTDSPFFVIEADEYDTAFFDKRSKFVHYRPRTAILNNLEFDHADIFPDIAAIETQFHHLVRTVPASGLIVANGRDAALQRVLERGCWTPVERFGIEAGGWQAHAVDATTFDVVLDGQTLGRVEWGLLGEHNRMNGLAAIAAARHAGVPPAAACAALGRFESVRRRLEVRGTVAGVTVYDDFAHHPTAIASTLEGLRNKVGPARPPAAEGAQAQREGAAHTPPSGGRILAVLEPRSNTMKLGVMKAQLPDSLAAADQVYVYAAELGWDARPVFAAMGERVQVHHDLDELVEAIAREAGPGDHVLIMSNGAFGGIHDKLLARLGRS